MEARAGAGLQEWRPRILWLLGRLVLLLASVVFLAVYIGRYSPPHFSVSVTGFSGLDVRSIDAVAAAAPPTFRVENHDFGQHCYTERSAAVELDGVPLPRADRFDGFCVPGQGAVEVPFVVTGGGLGIPDGLYDKRGGVGDAVALRVRLDGDVVGMEPVLLRCMATLDGRPSEPCARFLMVERGIYAHS